MIGAGGLGSPALLYLAAAGVGTIGIVEFDDVDTSNLQRQIMHGESDVGRPKAVSARDSIREINSGIDVRLHQLRLEPRNAVNLFRQYDLDPGRHGQLRDPVPRQRRRRPGRASLTCGARSTDSRARYRCSGRTRRTAADSNYRDLYPEAPPPGMVPSCAEGGVLGVLCASIGSIMVTEAIKLITGIGEPLLGRLMIYDALAMTYRTLRLQRDPARTRRHRTDRLRRVLRRGVR